MFPRRRLCCFATCRMRFLHRISVTESVSEAKKSYQDKFDDINETIIAIKDRLKRMHERTPQDNRIVSLLTKIEKCENEIEKICDEIREYSIIVAFYPALV